jgi:hypothetical protein
MNNSVTVPRIWWLALASALLPFLTIHLSFVVSVLEGHGRWCFPYWETCTSISKTGRHGTGYFIFKGGMIPTAVLLFLFWGLNRAWLRSLGLSAGAALPWLGVVSSLSLLVYTLSLGHVGDVFYLLRRTGVVGWFGLTWIAQLQLGAILRHHVRWRAAGQGLLTLSLLTLLLALSSLVLLLLWPERHDDLENAYEWSLALLLDIHAFATALLWQRSGFSLTATSSKAD